MKKRLIFTLLVDDGQFQLSRNFSRQKVGDLNWLFNSYHAESIFQSIDELVVLNISKDPESFDSFINLLTELSQHCFMPIAAGGGVTSMEKARKILCAGADKVVLNSTLFTSPELIEAIANTHGKQSIIGSVDYRLNNNEAVLFIEHGATLINQDFEQAFQYLSTLPIGELYLTSIDQDGTGRGYDLAMLSKVEKWIKVPLIASGGVGKFEHLYEGMQIEKVTGVSTANLFNFIGDGLQLARAHLIEKGIAMASWDFNQLDVFCHDPA